MFKPKQEPCVVSHGFISHHIPLSYLTWRAQNCPSNISSLQTSEPPSSVQSQNKLKDTFYQVHPHRHKRSGGSSGALRHPKDKEDAGMFPGSSSFLDD